MEVNRIQLKFQVVLFIVIGLLSAATIYVASLSSQQHRAVMSAASYDVAFSAGQASSEFLRFANRIKDPELPANARLQQDAVLRYDIFYSRKESFNSGLFIDFGKADEESRVLIEDLDGLFAKVDPLITRLDEVGVAAQINDIIHPYELRMVALAAAANSFGAGLVADAQSHLITLHWLFSAITALLIMTGFLLILLLMWNKRLLGRMHGELLVSANEARLQGATLTRQNVLFTAALNNMSQGLCMFDPDEKLIVANEKFSELFGLEVAFVNDEPTVDDLIEICQVNGLGGAAQMRSIFARPKGHDGDEAVGQFFEDLTDGRVISVSRQHLDDGGWLITQEDVTKRRKAENELTYLASHDVLTGLANRNQFCSSLQSAIDRRIALGEPAAVVCFNLDRFNAVIETLGHGFGDLLLKTVADRTNQSVKSSTIVSRLGSHEFAVLLKGIASIDRANEFVNKLLENLTDAYELDGHKVVIGVSVGVVLVSDDVSDAEIVLRNANFALQLAVANGGNDCQVYDCAMEVSAEKSPSTAFDLWRAFENGEIELSYQPQIDLGDYQITGVEAVLHWRHPTHGLLPASAFMRLAEDIGLAEPLGLWALNQACRDAMSWPRLINLSVNLSYQLFVRSDLPATIKSVLETTGLPGSRLELELEEPFLLQENASALQLVKDLKSMNISFTLDEFGAGPSSLQLVRRFPFDKIKIEAAHVNEIGTDPETLAVIQAVAALGNGLHIRIAAEGITTTEQMRLLHLAGCSEGQGHLFSKCLSSDRVSALLNGPPSAGIRLEAEG